MSSAEAPLDFSDTKEVVAGLTHDKLSSLVPNDGFAAIGYSLDPSYILMGPAGNLFVRNNKSSSLGQNGDPDRRKLTARLVVERMLT